MALTTLLGNQIAGALFASAPLQLLSLQVALLKSVPDSSGSGIEVSGGSYAHAQCSPGSDWNIGMNADGKVEVSNLVPISFPSPTNDWGVIAGALLLDSVGNPRVLITLSQTVSVDEGDNQPAFAAGTLTFIFE